MIQTNPSNNSIVPIFSNNNFNIPKGYLNMVDSVSDMYVDYLDMFTKIKAFIE